MKNINLQVTISEKLYEMMINECGSYNYDDELLFRYYYEFFLMFTDLTDELATKVYKFTQDFSNTHYK